MSSLDAYLKQAGVSVGTSTKKSSLDEYLAQARPTAQTPAIQPAPEPTPKRSTLSRVGGVIKDVAKETASSAVTIPARIPQAVASLSGASNEDINRVSSKLSGGLIAPVPESGADVMKDVGRTVETAAFAIPGSTAVKLGVGGAVSGLGASVRQGNDVFSKETAIQTALGGGFGYGLGKVLPKIVPKIVPKFSNKVAKTETEIAEEVATKTEEAPIKTNGGYPETKPAYPMGEASIPQKAKTTAVNDPLSYQTPEEFVNAQGIPVYHGGSLSGEINLNKSNFNKTFYISDSADYAKSFGGNKSVVSELRLSPEAKLADMRKPSQSLISQLVEKIKTKEAKNKPYSDKNFSFYPYSTTDVISGISQGKAHFAELPQIKDILRELGYDGQITAEVPYAKNIGIWNKDIIKTRSQLTDIWKKAQSGTEKEAAFQRIVKSEENVPLRERQTNPEQVRIALTERIEDIEDVVLRGREPLPGSNKGAYWSVLADEAERRVKLGDMSLAMKISSSNAPANLARETGQTLQSFSLVAKNNIFKAINELKMKMLESKVPSSMKKDIPAFQAAEIDKFKKEYKKIVEEVASVKLTKEELTSVFNSMLC